MPELTPITQVFSSSAATRIPPQAVEAEQSVLGALMIDNEAIHRIADVLAPRDFYMRKHGRIYEAMFDLYRKSEPIDFLSTLSRLRERAELEDVGGASYLTELINLVPTAAHVHHYARIVKRKKILRDLIEASQQITDLGFQEHEDIDMVLDSAEQKIFAVSQQSIAQDFQPVKATLTSAFERLEELHRNRDAGALRGVATGFTDLDNLLSGLQKSDLIILAARPSLGKTSLALDILRHVGAKQKLPVGIFSLEMSRDQLVDRLIAAESKVDLWRLRTGRLSAEGPTSDFERIQFALGSLAEAPIFIDDTPMLNVIQIRTMARRLQAEHGLRLIVVDYLQLIQGRTNVESLVQQTTEISRSLKALARELQIPVLALSQLSRAIEQRSGGQPKLSDLRDSGCLAGDTLIIRADTGEQIPIKTLANRKEQLPIPVFSLEQDFRLGVHQMTHVFSSGKKMVYELKTRSGRMLKASANHPFWSIKGWSRLDELSPGDSIALPRSLAAILKNGISREQMLRIHHVLSAPTLLQLAVSDIFWDKIISVTKLGVEDVYDATVETVHNFVANDVIVHNSLEQDSDVVLFIYREDRERQNSERQNIADIIIAKHRNGPIGRVSLYFDAERASFQNLEKTYSDAGLGEGGGGEMA